MGESGIIMGKIVLMVLITLTMGQAKQDFDIMKDMMAEMNERLSLAEGKLAKSEDELTAAKDDLAITKDDLANTKDVLALTKDELAITKDDLAVAKDDLAITKARTDELEREVAIVRAPPYINCCGSHYDVLSASSGTIPYTSLLYSSTNTEGGGLDISTGVFTAPHGGSYTVYWDTTAYLDSGERVSIYVQKNGENIQESKHYSRYTGPSGWVGDQGGRTIIVYLGVGDTLQLYMDASSGEIGHTTFCVSLTTFDIV